MSAIVFPRRWFLWFLPGLMVVASIAGCGNGLVRVEGNVTYDGKPMELGTISFDPVDGQSPVVGGKIEGGAYRVENCTPGKKTVRIVGTRKTGRRVKAGSPFPPDLEVDEFVPLPCKPQSVEFVAKGPNQFDFHLKSP